MNRTVSASTPWQRVYAKFGMSQSEFARALKRHRAKVSRALKDADGLISGKDQKLILAAAKEHNVRLSAADMVDA
ncbi:ParB-like chromosome segregation protein Spo0J [Bradyrhizobium elkanii]